MLNLKYQSTVKYSRNFGEGPNKISARITLFYRTDIGTLAIDTSYYEIGGVDELVNKVLFIEPK